MTFTRQMAWTAGLALTVMAKPLHAQMQTDPSPSPWQFKLTPSVYTTTGQTQASDVNLRAYREGHALWLGHFEQSGNGQQTRAGYEYTVNTPWGQVVPSIQSATGGFLGGSINLQVGQTIYAMAGLGRTNLRNYYNLNFDPNDAITLGLGTWFNGQHQLALFRVQDNRLHTGQQVTHLVWRHHMPDGQRLTLDLASKQGRADPDGALLKGHSLTLTWDWSSFFVRMAMDQKVNFSNDDQRRLSLGLRF